MKAQAYRCLPITVLGFALVLLLSGLAAADESPRARGRADVPGRPAACPTCLAAQASCAAGCFASEDKAGFVSCMMDCDNTAAICTCDEPVSLRSEDFLPKPDSSFELAAACHGQVSCQPNYPSCAGWTAFFDCGNPYCAHYKWCPDDCENEFGCYGPAMRQKQERYRVCFNNLGQQCTEWQSGGGYVLSCDC